MLFKRWQKLSLLIATLSIVSCGQNTDAPQTEAVKTRPLNIILMVSDGNGFNGWLATDYYQGMAGKQSYQITRPDGTKPLVYGLAHSALNLLDENGEVLPKGSDVSLAVGAIEQGYDPARRWAAFDYVLINDFLPVKKPYTSYTDSAAAGTALMSGRKTAVGRVNMDWTGTKRFDTIAQLAMKRGMAAGAVTSVMASHATPAAAFSHNISRENYDAIFNEMLTTELSVIMGAGHPLYDDSGDAVEGDAEYKYVGGQATYNKLISDAGINGFTFIDDRADFESIAAGNKVPKRLVGIARSGSTLQAARKTQGEAETLSGMAFNANVPDLATMSKAALNVLSQDEDGFFVMIEGGAVDWMGHANNMPRFIEEHVDFNAAVAAVIDWVETNSNWDETLLIVTSDHECGGIWGEGTWTNSIGGAVAADRSEESIKAARFNPREDVFNGFIPVQNKGAGNLPGYQFASGNHTNDLVPLWAIGVGAERFAEFTRSDKKAAELWGDAYNWQGEYVDNTSVFHVMEAALTRQVKD